MKDEVVVGAEGLEKCSREEKESSVGRCQEGAAEDRQEPMDYGGGWDTMLMVRVTVWLVWYQPMDSSIHIGHSTCRTPHFGHSRPGNVCTRTPHLWG